MEQELVSEGKCLYCGETFLQKAIAKHLSAHLAQMEKEIRLPKPETWCHAEVKAGEMFLQLLVKGSAKMKDIDNFLRKIWLECCGHMSGFSYKKTKISMSDTVATVFLPKIEIFHDYDYGSTTRVTLKSNRQFQLSVKGTIVLLSRNEPLKLFCSVCKKQPAISLCTTCFEEEDAFYCETCAVKHEKECEDFTDYSNMPVVNSPRLGVCGYTGGQIDLERDGHYKIPI